MSKRQLGVSKRRIRALLAMGALVPIAALVWMLLAPSPRPAEEQFARGEELLRERIGQLRTGTSKAARRLEEAAPSSDADGFDLAHAIRAEEGVDGLALLDRAGRTIVWSGRTFDIEPDYDLIDVRKGLVSQSILEHPAHHVLYTARPAGNSIAIAFAAFDERFPVRIDLGEQIAREAGLHAVELRYASDSVPLPATTKREHRTVVVEGLVHATFLATTEQEADLASLEVRADRGHLTLVLALAWIGLAIAYRLRRTEWYAPVAIAVVAVVRTLLYHYHLPDNGPGQTLMTGVAALAAVGFLRTMRLRPRTLWYALLPVLIVVSAVQWQRFVRRIANIGIDNGLFDATTSLPGTDAALLIGAAAGATLALVLLVLLTTRFWPTVTRWTDRVGPLERTALLSLLTAVVLLPFLDASHDHAVERDLAAQARRLLYPAEDTEADARLDAAVRNAIDPDSGVNYYVAAALKGGFDPSHLAFFLWAASDWAPTDPCAVEVYDANLRRVSSFDFDAPPANLLPRAPSTLANPELRRMPGRGTGASITYRVRDIPLHEIGEEEPTGLARFVMPYRWDLLRSELRPPLFSEPFATLGRSAATPLVLAELGGDGAVEYVSRGSTGDLAQPDQAVLDRAHEQGHASLPLRYAGRDARMLVVPGRERFAAVVYESSRLKQMAFEAAHVLFVIAMASIVWVVWSWRRDAWAFRHTIALVLVILSVLPVAALAIYQVQGVGERYEADIDDQLRVRLDLAEQMLRKVQGDVDNAWCVALSTDHHIDLNVYEGKDLVATSRPGVWNTGLLSRQLSARAFESLVLGQQREYLGHEPFAGAGELRAGYRRVAGDRIIAAPELTDRKALEREKSEETARVLALYVLAAAIAASLALPIAVLLLRPVRRLQAATREVAAGNLDVDLPPARARGELGDLERSFASMTRDLRDAQDLRVRGERLSAWREMAQQIAHDVKNPLTPMKLTIQNLLAIRTEDAELFDEEFERGANVILEEIDRLQRIAGNFSTYARVPQRNLERVQLNTLLREVAKLHEAAGRIELNLCEEPVFVEADRDELHRVLHNLIINARDAEATSITLECRHEQGVRLDVIDNGRGISDEAMARIFEPSFTTRTRGTGLGLPIVQRIIEDLGGSIALDSEPGAGTRVTIRLPAD